MGKNGWIVTMWVDAPEDWNAERVREEVDDVIGKADSWLTLNTIHTPKEEGADES